MLILLHLCYYTIIPTVFYKHCNNYVTEQAIFILLFINILKLILSHYFKINLY